jgi:hypothetical protein
MSDLTPADELLKNHPSVRNFGSDTEYDWDQSAWYRICSENVAEANGIPIEQAKTWIKNGCDNESSHIRPRDESIPLSNTVANDGDN